MHYLNIVIADGQLRLQLTTGEHWLGPAPLDEYQEALHTISAHQYNATHNVPYAATSPKNPGQAQDTPGIQEHGKNSAENPMVEDELRMLDYPSIYFLRHKFPPIFLDHERRNIFEIVLPEMYINDFAASVKDTEAYLVATQEKLRMLEKQLQLQTGLIQRVLQEQSMGRR